MDTIRNQMINGPWWRNYYSQLPLVFSSSGQVWSATFHLVTQKVQHPFQLIQQYKMVAGERIYPCVFMTDQHCSSPHHANPVSSRSWIFPWHLCPLTFPLNISQPLLPWFPEYPSLSVLVWPKHCCTSNSLEHSFLLNLHTLSGLYLQTHMTLNTS